MREWNTHSYEKISILADYLPQFVMAAGSAPNRVYIDAFAGDTMNVLKGMDREIPGSAQVALEVSPPFTRVRLFETRSRRARALRGLLERHPGIDGEVIEGDCNEHMGRVLAGLPTQAPTFALLDPDGMELAWSTVRQIAEHKRPYAEEHGGTKVEMWVLFSTMGISRVLGGNREHVLREGLHEKVARLYGAWGPWEAVWEARLAGRISGGDAKHAYLYLYMDRLADLGYQYLLVRPIEGPRGELYAMVFATDHPAGDRIMRWAQEKDRVRPRADTLFDVPEARGGYEDLYTDWRDEIGIELPPWEEYA